MRRIDADALKEQFDEIVGEYTVSEIRKLIDNAPTVEYPFYAEAYQTGYEEGKNERPQGEWKLVSNICNEINVVCPFCGNTRIFAYAHGYSIDEVKSQLREVNDLPNYCEDCGAKMKEAENE